MTSDRVSKYRSILSADERRKLDQLVPASPFGGSGRASGVTRGGLGRLAIALSLMSALLITAAAVLIFSGGTAQTAATLDAGTAIQVSRTLERRLEASAPPDRTLPLSDAPVRQAAFTVPVAGAPQPAAMPALAISTALSAAARTASQFDPQAFEPKAKIETFSVALKAGDTLMKTLLDAGADRTSAHQAIKAMTPTLNPRRLQPGQNVHVILLRTPKDRNPLAPIQASLTNAPDWPMETRLIGMRMKSDINKEVAVRVDDNGDFIAEEIVHQLEQRMTRVKGSIRSSLFGAARELGVPDRVIIEFVRILQYSVDFQREIRQGDTFEILYTEYIDDRGNPLKVGDILFASMTNSGKTQNLYRFETPDDGTVDYFDESGNSIRKFLMRTPVDAARISSRFGRRFHPIHKRWKAHNGVDFAAPTGTKIYAAGNGTITHAGNARGYGNLIKIRHSNGYETRYGHLSRIARGIKKGTRVTQGQVIGYVGTTGWSTGPHLHYEVRKQGTPVNPLSIKVPTGRRLEGSVLTAFKQSMESISERKTAARLVTETRTASVLQP